MKLNGQKSVNSIRPPILFKSTVFSLKLDPMLKYCNIIISEVRVPSPLSGTNNYINE
jgi:hypothetical protein